MTRVFMAFVKESYDEDYPEGMVICYVGINSLNSTKGHEQVMNLTNVKTMERKEPCKTIGLGYHDFKDKAEYENSILEVTAKKLEQVGLKYREVKFIMTETRKNFEW